ncbi:MAG: hypothetical protein MJE68_30140 [Proteobacteria bacterium]|nr:hypothetical protein [Pseudomonadota bacterium]
MINDWMLLAPSLRLLTESDQKEIAQNFKDNHYLQKKEALIRWRSNTRGGPERSTYLILINFIKHHNIKVSQYLVSMQLRPDQFNLLLLGYCEVKIGLSNKKKKKKSSYLKHTFI